MKHVRPPKAVVSLTCVLMSLTKPLWHHEWHVSNLSSLISFWSLKDGQKAGSFWRRKGRFGTWAGADETSVPRDETQAWPAVDGVRFTCASPHTHQHNFWHQEVRHCILLHSKRLWSFYKKYNYESMKGCECHVLRNITVKVWKAVNVIF